MSAFYSIQLVALGGSTGLVGITWSFGAVIEVPLMYAFPRLGARFGTERLVVVGALAFAAPGRPRVDRHRSGGAGPDRPARGARVRPDVFVGGVTVLAARLPMSLGGTAQGLFSASAGLATIIGSVVGGTIAGAWGSTGCSRSARRSPSWASSCWVPRCCGHRQDRGRRRRRSADATSPAVGGRGVIG